MWADVCSGHSHMSVPDSSIEMWDKLKITKELFFFLLPPHRDASGLAALRRPAFSLTGRTVRYGENLFQYPLFPHVQGEGKIHLLIVQIPWCRRWQIRQDSPLRPILISLRNTAIVTAVIYIFYFTKPAYLSEHQIYFVKVFNGNLMNRDLWMTINAGCISMVFIYYGLILPSLPFLLRWYSCKSSLNEPFIISAPRQDKEIHFLEQSLGMRRSIVNEYVYERGEKKNTRAQMY